MTPTVFGTPYGRPAAEVLRQRLVAVKAADPLQPATVVVPSNYVAVSVRRLLASGALGPIAASGSGLAGITLLTIQRLAELLGAPRLAGAGRRPVSTPVLGAAARWALRREPGVFGPVAGHPATEVALVRAYRELAGVSHHGLDALAGAGPRAAQVVLLHRLVRERLAPGWYDEADLLHAAADAVRERAAVVADLGVLVLYLPQDLRPPACGLVRALAEKMPLEVVAGLTGDPAADTDVHRTVESLGGTAPESAVAMPLADEFVSVSDPEDEVRGAVRRVVDALRAGTTLDRIGLLYPTAEPYAQLCHEYLAAAGIPYNGAAVRPLAQRLVGRWLLDVLAVGGRGWRRAEVLDLVAAAPVRALDGRPLPVGRWERISRAAGVVRGRESWRDRLARLASDRRLEADRELGTEDPRGWLADRLRQDADEAEALAGFVADLASALDKVAGQASWSGLVVSLRWLVDRYLGGPDQRGGWPDSERAAADRIDAVLDRIAGLDGIDDAPSLDALRRSLELELDSDLARVGRFGAGVLVGRLADVLGVDLDLVILLGCAEGLLPSRVREDSLLPDAERQATTELRPRAERVGVEHRHLLAAMAAAGRRVLSYPRGDLRRSIERPPSRWLLDAVALRRDDGVRELAAGVPGYTEIPSFAGGLAGITFPATAQEHRLRSLGDRAVGDRGPIADGDPVLAAGLAMLRGRQAPSFTRYDGDLSGVVGLLPAPTDVGQVVSPTSLETWTHCPFRWFAERVLKVGPVEEPGELLSIDPRDSGELIHAILETWIGEAIAAIAPAPGVRWSAQQRAVLRRQAEAACDDVAARGLTGHPRLWGRDRARLLIDLDRFVDADDARRRREGATPIHVELGFGLNGTPPLLVDLDDGRSLRVRGKIDRVDRLADGSLLVTDYKTGGNGRYLGLTQADPVAGGERLQLPVYGMAVRASLGAVDDVRAAYWFASTKGQWREVGYPVTADVEAQLRAVLGRIADGMAAGIFVPRPVEQDTARLGHIDCWACDPDGLGSRELRAAWERKRADPRLAGYRALVEPETGT